MSESNHQPSSNAAALSARFTDSFAYRTVRDRLPEILARIVDSLCRRKSEFSDDEMQQVKALISGISELRYELQTDKPLRPIDDNLEDADTWNTILQQVELKQQRPASWFKDEWLLVECYMYRRLYQLVLNNKLSIDMFKTEKQQSLHSCANIAEEALSFCLHADSVEMKQLLRTLLLLSLWANRSDLSISGMVPNAQMSGPSQLANLQEFILCDMSEQFIDQLLAAKGQCTVDIVLDNAGFELVADLCLAECLLRHQLAARVRLHAKLIPWFVSDVTIADLQSTLHYLASSSSSSSSKQLAESVQKLMDCGQLLVEAHPFWTSPLPFGQMQRSQLGSSLFAQLQSSSFVILKGDLNYRKAVQDANWQPTHSLADAVGDFRPAPLLLLRTLKSDVVVGLLPGVAERAASRDADWMVNGSCAVVQFLTKE